MIENIARENLAEARALVAAFAPVGLDDSSLADALRRLGERFSAETGVRVSVVVAAAEGADALPAIYQVVLLRTAQEALANISKHAAATEAEIRLSTEPSGVASIEVTDNGTGLQPGPGLRQGFGLAGMRGRVEEVGGDLEIDSTPGAGTLIRVRLPAMAVP
jgi:signal transduction histidine kinase